MRHKITFEEAGLALGPESVALADYIDTCRRKRNVIDYMATETGADELVHKANVFVPTEINFEDKKLMRPSPSIENTKQ